MNLDSLWERYSNYGYEAVQRVSSPEPLVLFYCALLAFSHDDISNAIHYAKQASAQAPDSALFSEAAVYLLRVAEHGKQNVYVNPDAFTAFINGGGNVPLYEATSTALRHIYASYQTLSVLDVGVGNGHALLPALLPNVAHLGIIEPSPALLQEVGERLTERGVLYTTFEGTLQVFAEQDKRSWTVVQATYSLQSLPPSERPALFRWLRAHTQTVVVVEFDVPAFQAMYAPERVQYVVERYERGLAEYIHDQQLVAQGFLLPVMFGYFDQAITRTNYEQPREDWVNELQAAGFQSVVTRELYSYWWAPAFILEAQ